MKIKKSGRIWIATFEVDRNTDCVGVSSDLEVAKAICEQEAEDNEISISYWRKAGDAFIAKTDDEFSYFMVFKGQLFSQTKDPK